MRTRLLAALLPTIVLTGCLQSTTIVKVNADGSGTLDNQTLMTAAALAQVRQLSGVLGGTNAKPFDPFSEEQARTFAGQMGDGVTLLSSMPINTATGEGRASVFGFRDVTKLRVSQGPATPGDTSIRAGGLGLGGDRGSSTLTIDLTRTPAGNALLTLHTGADPLTALLNQVGSLNRGGQLPADQIAVIRQMLAGMHVALRVEPMGRLVRTNSPYVDGQTVTLFDVDLDTLLKDEEAFTRLQNASTPAETTEALKRAPGVKIAAEREITIEFAP